MKNPFFIFIYLILWQGCALRDEGAISNNLMPHSGDSILYEHTHYKIPNTTIRAIKVLDQNHVYFAGSNGKWGYTLNGGTTWHVDSIANHEFRSIEVTPNRTLYLVSVQKPTVILSSTNNGKSFTPSLTLPDSMFLDEVFFSNNSNGVAIADPIKGKFQIYTTHNGGFTWEKTKNENLPTALENEYPFAASNSVLECSHQHIWFCTGGPNKARVHFSEDFGKSWSVSSTPIVSNKNMTGIFSVHMANEKLGIAAGGDWDSLNNPVSNMIITHNGGQSWKELSPENTLGYISDMQFIPDFTYQRIIAIKGTSKQTESAIFYSANQGETWKTYHNKNHYISIRFANKNVAWLCGKNGIGRLEIAD